MLGEEALPLSGDTAGAVSLSRSLSSGFCVVRSGRSYGALPDVVVYSTIFSLWFCCVLMLLSYGHFAS